MPNEMKPGGTYRFVPVKQPTIKYYFRKKLCTKNTAPGCDVKVDLAVPAYKAGYDVCAFLRIGTGQGYTVIRLDRPGAVSELLVEIMDRFAAVAPEFIQAFKDMEGYRFVSTELDGQVDRAIKEGDNGEGRIIIDLDKEKEKLSNTLDKACEIITKSEKAG